MTNKTYTIKTKEIQHTYKTYVVIANNKQTAKKSVLNYLVDFDDCVIVKTNIKIEEIK